MIDIVILAIAALTFIVVVVALIVRSSLARKRRKNLEALSIKRSKAAKTEATIAQGQRTFTSEHILGAVELPAHRPAGQWVVWGYNDGHVQVAETGNYLDQIDRFVLRITDAYERWAKFSVELVREKNSSTEPTPIEVYAEIYGTSKERFKLGYVPVEASSWLAKNFNDEMPITALITEFRNGYYSYRITIQALMPPKNISAHFRL